MRIVGFRDGNEVARSDWFDLTAAVQWCGFDLTDVDRLEVLVRPGLRDAGWVAIDDLAFRDHGSEDALTVLDFESVQRRSTLTGSGYGGLIWETGTGLDNVSRGDSGAVHAPKSPDGPKSVVDSAVGPPAMGLSSGGTPPVLSTEFSGPVRGDPGGGWYPPDTCGAVGLNHFVSIVNANLSVFRKDNGQRLTNVGLDSFWGQTVGDPRVVFDPHSQRFIAMATDFNRTAKLYFAVSRTSDPTGAWFKFSFRTDLGSDAGKWPDYPTLGVDARGIYTSAYMVGSGGGMTIWAIDKAPLVAAVQSVGTITAWRGLRWEGAIQPAVTYGDPGSEYLVSRRSSTLLRVRRIGPPLTGPQLFEAGSVSVPSHGSPPNAPALGSSTPISTIDYRPMNAVFRNGSLWTIQNTSVSGRAVCRWYELGVSPLSAIQIGTIGDPVWHYYYGSIAVDARGDVALGFSGSHANSYVGAFVTGRLASDPAGATADPIEVKPGMSAYQRVDGAGRNRWGDYSLTSVDPVDDFGFWSIQEYAGTGNNWRTWITQLGFESFNYGLGWPGTNGVPALQANGRPALGSSMSLLFDNSSGSTAVGALVVGMARASIPILDGTLLVAPMIGVGVSVVVPRATVALPIPNDPTLVGQSVMFQGAQVDVGASQGVSFTPGLELRPVTR